MRSIFTLLPGLFSLLLWTGSDFCVVVVQSFQPSHCNDVPSELRNALLRRNCARTIRPIQTWLYMSSFNPQTLRRGIKVPLLDVPDPENGKQEDHQPLVVVPLPSDHLPPELRDLNVYGMELSRPVHKRIMEDALERAERNPIYAEVPPKPMYGHIAWKKPGDDSSLVGAIGCVSEILLQADGNGAATMMGGGITDAGGTLETAVQSNGGEESGLSKTIVASGAFRFVVKQVTQTVPYPVAIVDELPDQEVSVDDDDDDDDKMSPTQIIQELFQNLQSYVDQKVEEASNKEMSLLERSILEDTGIPADPVATEQTRAEQMAAVLITFRTSLVDICLTPRERYFAVAFLAAEMVDLKNPIRREMLAMVDGLKRLRLVAKEVNEAVGMERARKMAKEITDTTDESSKDLMVSCRPSPMACVLYSSKFGTYQQESRLLMFILTGRET